MRTSCYIYIDMTGNGTGVSYKIAVSINDPYMEDYGGVTYACNATVIGNVNL